MSNDGFKIPSVPPQEASWLKSSLESLGSASRAMLLGATALVSVCAAGPASAQQPVNAATAEYSLHHG